MKHSQLVIILGCLASSVHAGIYVQSFTVTDGTTNMGDGSIISGDAQVNSNALRLVQDGQSNQLGNFIAPDLDPGLTVTSFTMSLQSYLSSTDGNNADGFSINFGSINESSLPQGNESGMVGTPMLSLGFHDWSTTAYITLSVNGSEQTRYNNAPLVINNGSGQPAQPISLNVDTNGLLDLNYNGTAIFTDYNVISAGFSFVTGQKFGVAARNGNDTQDTFIDQLNISTTAVPEPASIFYVAGMTLLALGMRRVRRR